MNKVERWFLDHATKHYPRKYFIAYLIPATCFQPKNLWWYQISDGTSKLFSDDEKRGELLSFEIIQL